MRDSVPRPSKWVVVLTQLLGVVTAIVMATGTSAANLTFAGVNQPVQAAMSVLTPLIGILMVHAAGRTGPTLAAAIVTNAVIAVVGLIVSAVAVAVAAPTGGGVWDHWATIVLGSLLVQTVATLVGTGFGLLMRWKVVAFLSTIVFPAGVFLLLGAIDALRPARPFLTPLAISPQLLSGQMSALQWGQWLVMASIWAVGLNALGLARIRIARSKAVRANAGQQN